MMVAMYTFLDKLQEVKDKKNVILKRLPVMPHMPNEMTIAKLTELHNKYTDKISTISSKLRIQRKSTDNPRKPEQVSEIETFSYVSTDSNESNDVNEKEHLINHVKKGSPEPSAATHQDYPVQVRNPDNKSSRYQPVRGHYQNRRLSICTCFG